MISALEVFNRDIFATRYLSGKFAPMIYFSLCLNHVFAAVGLVMLLYDHALTLSEEISLIWKSPPSFAKYAFLLNRYLVPLTLLTIAFEMCGLSGIVFTDGVSSLFLFVIETSYWNLVAGVLEVCLNLSNSSFLCSDLCSCQFFMISGAMLGITSIGLANLLVLMRVVMLWNHNVVRRNLGFVWIHLWKLVPVGQKVIIVRVCH